MVRCSLLMYGAVNDISVYCIVLLMFDLEGDGFRHHKRKKNEVKASVT